MPPPQIYLEGQVDGSLLTDLYLADLKVTVIFQIKPGSMKMAFVPPQYGDHPSSRTHLAT